VLAVAWPIRLLWLRRVGGLSPRKYFRPYPSLLGAAAAMVVAVIGAGQLVTDHRSVVQLAVQIPVGIVVYALALLLFARREPWPFSRA
jgi:hypothetical protein